jgi:hypothetical protein
MPTKNREKLLLIAAGVMAGLWLLNMLVISPLMDSWDSRSKEIDQRRKDIDNGAMLVRRESAIRDQWDNMRANALPNNPTAAERQIYTAFDHWVSAGGVVEGSFRPTIAEGEANYSTVDCRADVSGSLRNIRDFVRAMSRDPVSDKVQSFELASKDDNGRQLTLGLNMSGLILIGFDPTTVTPPPKTVEPPPPEGTNSATNSVSDPFRLIALNNIFNQSRIWQRDPGSDTGPLPVTHRRETLTSLGSIIDHGKATAFFEGTKVSASRFYNEGASVSDLKVAKIALKSVTLTNSSSNVYVLPTDGSTSLRREDDGPWHTAGYTASISSRDATTNSTASNSSTSAPGAAPSSMEEMLRKRRLEQQ